MTTTPTSASATGFRTRDGLRALLRRLDSAGPRAWECDPEAGELMEYAAEKYAALARKHGLDPWEAASAAFDVMRTKACREAIDPWGVVTHAVRITCIAEERAQGLLCSVHQARRPRYSVFHDAERFSERENTLTDYHPAFHITDTHDLDTAPEAHPAEKDGMSAMSVVAEAVLLLTLLGWAESTAQASVEHVCETLARAGTRHAAYEALRRDKHAQALLDLPRTSWTGLLRALLGNPEPAVASTSAGRGVLLRLLIGEPVPALLHDDDLVLTISLAAPPQTGSAR